MTSPCDPVAAATHPDPYPYYRELATRRPIYRDDGLGMWVVSGADAVTAALTSDAARVRPAAEPVPASLLGSPAGEIFGRLVRMNDGAYHRDLRRAVVATLAAVGQDRVAAEARRWAEPALEAAEGTIEGGALDDVIFRLPAYVMGSLLGVPPAKLGDAASLMGGFARCLAPSATAAEIERGKAAAAELIALFRPLLADRDGKGALARRLRDEAGRAGGGGEDAAVANAIGFLFQTYDATAGLLGNALVALGRRPALRRAVAADRLLLPDFVREVLRHDPPVQNTRRFVAEPATIAGRPMATGDAILVVLAAANRDPSANADPDRFEIARNHRRIFTFGAARHACPGEAIAITIATVGVGMLAARIPDLGQIVDGVRYRPSANARIPRFGRPEQGAGNRDGKGEGE